MQSGPLSIRILPHFSDEICSLGALAVYYNRVPTRQSTTVKYFCKFIKAAIYQNRFHLFLANRRVIGYVIWCWLDEPAASRLYTKGLAALHPSDWTSGKNFFLLDLVIDSPLPHQKLLFNLRQLKFSQKVVKYRRRVRGELLFKTFAGNSDEPRRLRFEENDEPIYEPASNDLGQLVNLIDRSPDRGRWLLSDAAAYIQLIYEGKADVHWLYDNAGEAISFMVFNRAGPNLIKVLDYVSAVGMLRRAVNEIRHVFESFDFQYSRYKNGVLSRFYYVARG